MQLATIFFSLLGVVLTGAASAGEVRVAVSSDFLPAMERLAEQFEKETGHTVLKLSGSSGKLYKQIRHGVPIDVLLADNSETPARLEAENDGLAGTRFTYATGRLVLWSADANLVDAEGRVLKTGDFGQLAIAHPKLDAYGVAAVQTLNYLGLMKMRRTSLVLADDVEQAHSMVADEEAELGFVALSQMVYEDGKLSEGSAWTVPQRMHSPLRQDAILLVRGKNNAAAHALLAFMKTEPAKAVMRLFGYEFQ